VLPIICIALVPCLGHATGGARVLIWTCSVLRQWLVASWAEFQYIAWCTMRLISVEKHWKCVLMQKVVTLNTCCEVACLIIQLPHITTGSFQSCQWQPTAGSLQSLQHFKEHNKPSVRWKRFAVHELVWWHFQVGWASGLQFVFLWDNQKIIRDNQKCVWILLKVTFLDFPK